MGKSATNTLFEYEPIEAGLKIVRYIGPDDTKEVLIPGLAEENTKVLEIGDYAFYKCDQLERIIFAEGVTAIGTGSFALCRNLKLIGLPDSLKNIGQGAFFGCDSAQILAPDGLDLSEGRLCPECGMEAGPAGICPTCGFGSEGYDLRQHLKEKKEEEERLQKEREKEEEARRQAEEARQLKEKQERTINQLTEEIKKDRWAAIGYSLSFLACLIGTIWLFNPNGGFYHIDSAGAFVFLMFLLLIGDVVLFFGAYLTFKRVSTSEEDLEVAKVDLEQYEKNIEERKRQQEEAKKKMEEHQAQMKKEQQERYNREHPHPKCPMCGSYHTYRITQADRVNSAFWNGIASEYIGYQYECLDCKHKW